MSEYTPITGELRANVCTESYAGQRPSVVRMEQERFDRLCDSIDAIHAQLERENAELKAELDRVLGEQEEHAHTRGESITGELREVAAKTECANGRCEKLYRGDLERIADRIDAEHERECKEQYACGAEHGIGASIDASMIQTHGYVELPKDADGKVWRVGDEIVDDGMVCEVVGIGPNRLYYYVDATDTVEWTQADSRRHHHAPTVEDVLREFALKVAGEECMTMRTGVVEEFAAKLRLAESEDA